MNTTLISNYRLMDQEVVAYIYSAILCCSNEEQNHAIYPNIMELEDIVLSEISQKKR